MYLYKLCHDFRKVDDPNMVIKYQISDEKCTSKKAIVHDADASPGLTAGFYPSIGFPQPSPFG